MTGIMEGFDRAPQKRARLEANPELIPNAAQKCLRLVSPVAHMRRTAVEDTVWMGQQIKAEAAIDA